MVLRLPRGPPEPTLEKDHGGPSCPHWRKQATQQNQTPWSRTRQAMVLYSCRLFMRNTRVDGACQPGLPTLVDSRPESPAYFTDPHKEMKLGKRPRSADHPVRVR